MTSGRCTPAEWVVRFCRGVVGQRPVLVGRVTSFALSVLCVLGRSFARASK